jgi:predicted dithiol-disulfide oxidoreductase (DUF899 family)
MPEHKIVTKQEWLAARKELLVKEKELTRLRDQVSQARRELPWLKVDKSYHFDGPQGKESLSELFDGQSQLLVYHFMFDPSWEEGCKSCSFWADNYQGIIPHLKARDVTFVTISRAPLHKLDAFKKRMGWSFKWVSSFHTDFNHDFHVSFTAEELKDGKVDYNFQPVQFPTSEAPGVSVFYKDESGAIFHTYSCYSRGIDILNGAYHYLDLLPKGRDESALKYSMAWLRHHDKY